jgi:hypothetical protein
VVPVLLHQFDLGADVFAKIFTIDESIFTYVGNDHEFGRRVFEVIEKPSRILQFDINRGLQEFLVFRFLRGRFAFEVTVNSGAPRDHAA